MKLIFSKASVRPHIRTHPKTGAKITVSGYRNSKPSKSVPHHAPVLDRREWIGVDLDRTLAYYESGQDLDIIGHPIPAMIRRVKEWLRAGKRVKIMTARATDIQQIPKIQAWLVRHGLPKLEVTNVKDHLMDVLYDDKAVGIHPNTGKRTDRIHKAISNQGTFDPTDPDITKSQTLFKSVPPSQVPFPAHVITLKRKGKGGGHAIDYKTTFQGLPITIENRKGSLRHWGNPDDGTAGTTKMEFPYGYIRRTEGLDGDHVDCFLGPHKDATHAYVVHQLKAPDFIMHDEDKCLLGWNSAEEAAAAYLRHYNDARFFGAMTIMPMEAFQEKVARTFEHPGMIKSGEVARTPRFITHDELRYYGESADIKKNQQTAKAKRPHKFLSAKYTQKNGHPRCLICGEEETVTGLCAGLTITKSWKTLRLLLKAEGERWITVHPHGPGTQGQPIKIRESAGSPGTYHVVGGAGGKLNFMRLTGVKSQAEYKDSAKARSQEKRNKAKEQVKRDKELGLVESKKQVLSSLKSDRDKHQRSLIEQVATLKGWQDYDLKPEQLDGLSDRGKEAAILKHHRQLHRDAQQVIQATKESLLVDAEARSEAELGELSIHRDEPQVLGLTDLSPDPKDRGLGYQPDYGPTTEDITEEAQAFKDEQAASRDPKKQAALQRMQEAGKETREEVARAEETGQLAAPSRELTGVDPRHAVALLTAHKQTQSSLKEIQAKKKEVQGSTQEVQGKSYVIQAEPVSAQEVLKQLIDDAAERTRQDQATSFLSMVEHDPFAERPEDHQASLQQHIQGGSASMLARVSQQLTGTDIVPREVVDVLGTAGAAQALAKVIHENFPEDQVATWADQLAQYHTENQGTVTEEAIGRAKEAYDQAQEMVVESVESPSDLAIATELNEKRLALLREAREDLGTTLGELESLAAMNFALRNKPVEETMVSMGGVSTETAIRQLKALGLEKDDYDIDSDGTNHFALIAGDGLRKVIQPLDQDDVAHRQVVNDILDGKHDEADWTPAGFAHRPETSYTDPEQHAVRYAQPYHHAPNGTHEDDLQTYIGQRMADGHAPHEIYKDLFGPAVLGQIPEDRHDAYFEALDRVAPLYDEAGRPRKAESHQAAWEDYAEQTLTSTYGHEATPIHRQSLNTHDPKTFEAIHRVMAEDPTRGVAFTPIGELTAQEQGTLRHVFNTRFARPEDEASTKKALEDLGSEPPKESEGLFGTQDNPEWHEYQTKKQAILEEARSQGLTWDKYVKLHGSRERAYHAIQDSIRGEAAQAFAKEYGRVHRQPLKLGRTTLTNHLAHVDAIDPESREARLAEQRKLLDRVRNRTAGKYAGGSAKDKLDRVRELSAIADQNQRTMFTLDPEGQTKDRPLRTDERHTLGHTAEEQLAALWPQVSRNFSPDRPVKLMVNGRMDGSYINQQRAVKLIAHNQRMALALGTGSGKTNIGLGAFTHLHDQGKVKRGFYAVPSIVQGQFGSEAAAVLQPGKYSWWGKPDASRDERLAAYKNPDHHMVIVTHQGLRDDLVHLMAKQDGITEPEMAEQFKGMKEDDRISLMQKTLKAEGINPDFFMHDEGHDALNRSGKEDSLLSNVLDAFHMPLPYYVSSSADPLKNDLSELFSQLHKINPQKFNNLNAFMGKYGLKTNASQDVLRRELRRYLLPGKVDPGVHATHHEEPVSLTDHQQADYDAVLNDYRTARSANQKGAVDLGAAKRLSPNSFEGRHESEHADIAAGIHANLGIARDGALERVLNDTEPKKNAKAHKVLELANRYKQDGKPGVIFARSRKAVEHLHRVLTDEGHRALTITGSDTAKAKAQKIAQFRPPPGQDAHADIVVASDAAAVGANLQRGQYLIHYDQPHTAKTWWQRTGRIHRLGQKHDVHVHTLVTDTRLDAKKQQRLKRKSALRQQLTAPYESISDGHDLYTLLRDA